MVVQGWLGEAVRRSFYSYDGAPRESVTLPRGTSILANHKNA